jgi:hypothetical protein
MLTFDQEVLAQGDQVTATTDTGGDFQLESDLSNSQSEIDAQPGDHLDLGPAGIGCFAVRAVRVDDEAYFYSCVTILPEDDHLTLEHYDIAPSVDLPYQPFSNDVFSKFVDTLTVDRISDALRNAANAFPGDAAAAIGTTVVLAVAFFPEATAAFFIGSAVGLIPQFFGRINDSLIEGMVDDGSLLPAEGDFLKIIWGFQAVTSTTSALINGEEAIERVKAALETAEKLQDLSTPAGEMIYGVRIKTTDSVAPKTAVTIRLNGLFP